MDDLLEDVVGAGAPRRCKDAAPELRRQLRALGVAGSVQARLDVAATLGALGQVPDAARNRALQGFTSVQLFTTYSGVQVVFYISLF